MKKIILFLLFFFASAAVLSQDESIYLTSKEGNILTLSAWDDDDGDGIANVLEVQGFTYNPIDGLQVWDGDTTKKYYITDPLRWSTDGDPYSDYMEVTGVNMPAGVLSPENHPLVAARPIIRMGMESFDVIPISTITDTEGGDSSSSFTNTTSNENQVGVKVGSEFSFNPFKLASVSVEASYSHTWVNTESSTSSFGHNWSKTKSTNPSEAARLRLRVFMENIGSASALDVRPTFNLMIGNKTIATVTPNQVANILSPKNTSNSRYPQNGTIAIEKDQDNNDIILSLEELKSLQMGSPLSLVVIQVDANVIRWNSQTEDWTSNISWTSFENEINPVSIEILSEFGTDESKIYQVFAGTEYWNPEYNLRQILSNIFSVEDVNGETFIEGRKYPGDWYFSTSSVSILNEYNNQGQPENLLGLKMSKNSKLVMMTPGGDPNPLVSLATYSSDFKRIYVSAFPNNFPIISVKAKVKIGGSEREVPLTQGNGAFFTNAALFESSAEPQGTVIVENARGDVTESTIIFPALYTSALDVKENTSLLPNPGGDYLLFINGDEEKPVYIYCMFFKPGTDSLLETPREYLTLAKSFATTGEPKTYNYSFIPRSDSTKVPNYTYMYYGNDLTNYFEKVRINLSTLAVDPNDTTFTSSVGYLTLSEFTTWGGGWPMAPTFRAVPFGSSGNCYYNYEDRIENPGSSNINFENTSFKIDTTNLNEIIGAFQSDPSGDFIDFNPDSTFIDYSFTEWTIDMSGGGYPGFFGLTDSLRLVYAGFASPTSIEEIETNESIPSDFVLEQNYPNPFNPVTTIEFKIPEQTQVSLKIYDITGSEVAELVNEVVNAGNYRVAFTANNLASGIYIYRIQTNKFSAAKKLMLMK